ncbi:N-6 DNA methylase [Campylobacter upsaliensis]|uniref:N-6 DNA methylase n=1 Tax=Campylobacter upsaliensis TaxID=28080 RepID=UPI00126EE1EE|nr:N-6 DNA methylase [Campylobacter upsaliensis]EAH6261101.1 restriction endonuclease subunit M [Campylobacter upsaliensis]EAK0457054.1 restriction endonuclease subunit M [Campylobacter upsaliensis]EAK3562032.1 restriction endonuclease subunit M [Campylobacter upsaliensis]EAK9950382.1 restriction endonuclease subunit M [Campylobacter upsaliensis]EDP6887255.1 N-6 DNA methylase [Campylobacter upsaliensis]
MSDIIKKALEQGYLSFDGDSIIYHTKKLSKQNYTNPEEKVRAEVFARLIIEKEYPLSHIAIEVRVTRGSNKSNTRADIVVYKNAKHQKAFIVIELKKSSQKDLREAKEQALSYANFLKADYALATNGKEKIALYIKEDSNDLINDIPPYGGNAPIWKYLRNSENSDISKITTDELKALLEKIHNYLWNGGKRNPAEAFSEFSKIIFTKIMDEKIAEYDPDYKLENYEFQKNRDEDKFALENRIKGLYQKYKEKDSNVFDNALILDADEIKFLVENLESISLSETDLDIKGKVFQKFFADFFKGTAGQYFTPLNIVRFMVECFDLRQNDLVLDPSCGSGGFLLQTLQYMQEKSKKLDGEYNQKRFWHSFAEKNLYGIEINGGISQTAKMNMIIHDDGHTNVITADGLDSFENFIKKNNKFQKNTFNFIFTNPPFGSSIPASKPYFEDFSFAKSEVHFIDKIIDKKSPKDLSTQKSEILFLERYFEFLKEGGIVACVLPDGILTNSSLQNVRDYLLERFYLLASFSLPQHTFSNYGAGVKSSILVLKKKDKKAIKAFLDKKEAIQNAITQKHKDEILSLRDELKALITPLQKELKALEKMQDKDLKTQEQIATLKEKIANHRETYRYKEELVRDKICTEVSEKLKQLESYEVFMAIIENIGFDATGKELCEYEESELHTIALSFREFYQKHWGKNG